MNGSIIKERVRLFLGETIRVYDLPDDQDLFAGGFINSLFGMQLVAFVEKEFSISVENDDLDMANFSSISAIERYVTLKLQSGSPDGPCNSGTFNRGAARQ